MRKEYTKLFLINYLYLLILELIFKVFMMGSLDIGLLYIPIFLLPISLVITFISSLFKSSKVNRIISIIIWFLIYTIFISETIYFSFYKTICGLSALAYGGQVMEFFSSILQHIIKHLPLLIVGLLPFVGLIILSVRKSIKHVKFDGYITIVLFFTTLFFSLSSLEFDDNAKDLYYNRNDLLESTNIFGLNEAISLDSIKYITGFEENINVVPVKKLDYTKDNKLEYNVMNINFEDLINNETDDTIKSMHNYFNSQTPTNKNEYTGMFAGKNLIFITAEGFYPIAVDENLTPNLYKLVNNGFVFNNYYQPIYNCSTSDGEFINQLSILPGVSTCSMKSTIGTYLPFNVGNIMKNYGYNTYAFHGWTYSYYSRDKTMPNLGYEYYGYDKNNRFANSIPNIKYSWPTSDVDVINNTYGIYNTNKPFVSYYMSISGHLEYNFGGNAMAGRNKDAVKELNASTSIKAYIATQIEFDKSLGILLDNLKNDGILDDTVIVIGTDHYPYGLTNEEIASYVDWMKDPNFDLYKNNLIIYNSEMERTEVNRNVSSLDILPTVLNLFGVEYDSRLLIGHDVFSDQSDLVIFNNKSWITDKGRYDYIKKAFTPNADTDIPDGYVNSINEIVKQKFQMSKLLISKDYYRKVIQ